MTTFGMCAVRSLTLYPSDQRCGPFEDRVGLVLRGQRKCNFQKSFFFFFLMYLAASGLSCSMWALAMEHVGS